MSLEHLIIQNFQIQGVPELEHLIKENPLYPASKSFLMAKYTSDKSVKTLRAYCATLVKFQKLFSKPIAAVNRDDIRFFLFTMKEAGLSPNSQHHHYRNIKAFINWCMDEELIPDGKTPLRNVEPPTLPELLPTPFDSTILNKILVLCSQKDFISRRNRAIVLLFLETGLRLDELANIKLTDIDSHLYTIKVMGKGQRERIVGMTKRTIQALTEYLMMRNDKLPDLWLTEERTPLHYRGIQVMIKRLSLRAGVGKGIKKGPHTYRHTFGMMSLENGAREIDIQRIFGHATVSTSHRYMKGFQSKEALKSHQTFSPVANLFK